jgi:uncharacterized paraquat-inducible protein A
MKRYRSGADYMNNGACPECDAEVPFVATPGLNQRVMCPRCRAALVVIGIMPIELDWAFVEPLRDLYHDGADLPYSREWRNEI